MWLRTHSHRQRVYGDPSQPKTSFPSNKRHYLNTKFRAEAFAHIATRNAFSRRTWRYFAVRLETTINKFELSPKFLFSFHNTKQSSARIRQPQSRIELSSRTTAERRRRTQLKVWWCWGARSECTRSQHSTDRFFLFFCIFIFIS